MQIRIPTVCDFAASTTGRPPVFEPEVFALDAHEFQPSSEPNLISDEADYKPDLLTSRARLQTIASILAMAVIRRKTRMASRGNPPVAEDSLPDCGEGLDLSGEQSVHA